MLSFGASALVSPAMAGGTASLTLCSRGRLLLRAGALAAGSGGRICRPGTPSPCAKAGSAADAKTSAASTVGRYFIAWLRGRPDPIMPAYMALRGARSRGLAKKFYAPKCRIELLEKGELLYIH